MWPSDEVNTLFARAENVRRLCPIFTEKVCQSALYLFRQFSEDWILFSVLGWTEDFTGTVAQYSSNSITGSAGWCSWFITTVIGHYTVFVKQYHPLCWLVFLVHHHCYRPLHSIRQTVSPALLACVLGSSPLLSASTQYSSNSITSSAGLCPWFITTVIGQYTIFEKQYHPLCWLVFLVHHHCYRPLHNIRQTVSPALLAGVLSSSPLLSAITQYSSNSITRSAGWCS